MSNTITAYFKGRVGVAESVYQNDYGIVMEFDGIYLPAHFDCYFSRANQEEAVPGVGSDNRVAIPNSILANPGNVTIHIPMHTGSNDSEVEYVVTFNVIGRARPIDDGTPAQMTAVEKAIALLQQPIANIREIVNEALGADSYITESKLSDPLKLKVIKDYVTPEMFGAKGDGVTDDTQAIQDAIDFAITNRTTVRLCDGKTYGISGSLIVEGGWVEVAKSTGVIKALSALDEPLLSIRSPNIITDRTEMGKRRKISVNLDCNGSAIGIYCKQIFEYIIHDSLIKGAVKGIQVDSAGAELVFENCYIDGTDIENSVGVENNASDIKYQGIYMFNCHTAFDITAFCEISDCHPWMDRNIDGSIGIKTTATCRVMDSYIDTYQKCFYKSNGANLLLDNCQLFISGEFYDAELGNAYIFYGTNNDDYNYSLLSNLFITGSNGLPIKLSNINPFNIPMVNCRIESMIDKSMRTSDTGFTTNAAPLESVESGITLVEQSTAENDYARHIYIMLTATSAKSVFTDLATLRSQYAPKYNAQIMGMSTLDQKSCLFYISSAGKIQASKPIAANETYRISGVFVK